MGRTLILIAAALACALTGAPLAWADHGSGQGGLQRIAMEVGPDVWTHGPDPFEHPVFGPTTAPLTNSEPAPDTPRRPVACATDNYFRAVYAYRGSTSATRYEQRAASIRTSLEQANYYLAEQSVLAGGPWIDLKFRCSSGEIDVAAVKLDEKSNAFGKLVAELRGKTFDKPNEKYVVFVDETNYGSSCGTASIVWDERPVEGNLNNRGNAHAIVWQPCWSGRTPLHEIAHTMGAVQPTSPNSTGWPGAHCNDGHDIMCYSDGGPRDQGMRYPCAKMMFDCGRNDYFNPAPAQGSWLADHWNLASPLNKFIAFAGRPANKPRPPAPQPDPIPNPQPEPHEPAEPPKPEPAQPKAERLELTRGQWHRAAAPAAGKKSVYEIKVPKRAAELRVIVRGAISGGSGPYLDLGLKAPGGAKKCSRMTAGERVACKVSMPAKGRWKAQVSTVIGAGAPFEIKAASRKADGKQAESKTAKQTKANKPKKAQKKKAKAKKQAKAGKQKKAKRKVQKNKAAKKRKAKKRKARRR